MDSISEEYGVDQAAPGSDRSEPVVSVRGLIKRYGSHVILQESQPERGLSVRECLAMYAGCYRAPRDIDQTIALVDLTEKAGALGTRVSGGPSYERKEVCHAQEPSRGHAGHRRVCRRPGGRRM